MNLRKLILASAAGAALLGVPAQAAIVDNPQFQVLGIVIVWGANAAEDGNPIVSDFIIDTSAVDGQDADLIGEDVHAVVTGTLTPIGSNNVDATIVDGNGDALTGDSSGILDATSGDGFDAFTLAEDTRLNAFQQSSSFYVASNTNFSIDGEADLDSGSGDLGLDDITLDMSVSPTFGTATPVAPGSINFGADAQDPGGTFPFNGNTLDNMAAGTPIYDGSTGQRTAGNAGTIASQSVRFDAVYSLGADGSYDLSTGTGDVTANVTYTVFVP